MNAEIICIGNELLAGGFVNTNFPYLAQKVAEAGIGCEHQSTVGDDEEKLVDAIKRALDRADIVITTGGLGPTVDDVTLCSISKATERKLVFHPEILRRIKSHFARARMAKENIRQAYLPEGAKEIENNLGTAPGIFLKLKQKVLFALPGPPMELEPMVECFLLPYLKKESKGRVILTKSILTTGLCEADVNAKVKKILRTSGDVTVGIYARAGQVDLVITAKSKSAAAAKKKIAEVAGQIRRSVGEYAFGEDGETLEEIAGKILAKKKRTLAVAESATGGLICDKITDVPGSSGYFIAGIVSYSNESKIRELGVPPEAIKKYGAVSEQVARAMAQGARNLAKADYSLATTGICGPTGATGQKPVGTMYIALATPRRTVCKKFLFSGQRRVIKIKTYYAALDMLRRQL